MTRWAIRALLILVPLGLFALALALRVVAASGMAFPATEPSAYYVAVARNFLEGRGLVTDVLISYFAQPIQVPRPAFDVWQPLATFAAAVPMKLFGPTFANAQLSSIVLGALVAPLTWFVALDAALRQELSDFRAFLVALFSGVLAAILGPLVLSDVAPESTTAFTFCALAACWFMPRALPGDGMTLEEANRGRLLPRLVLGVLLGLAFLARQEAIYLVPAYIILLLQALGPLTTVRSAIAALVPTAITGALTVAPWLVRNYLTFGTVIPGSTLQYALLTRPEQAYAYGDRPSYEAFIAKGPGLFAGHIAEALWRNLVMDLLIPAVPVALVGLAAIVLLRRTPAVGAPHALRALIVSGLITYFATCLIFPVVSANGTYRHAAGPFMVGLVVMSMFGLDAFVGWVKRRRGWSRGNAWLAPAAALALAIPFSVLQISLLTQQTQDAASRFEQARSIVASLPPGPDGRMTPVVSDEPIRLAELTRRPAIILPDEPVSVVWRLARWFGSPAVVVVGDRGRYPEAFATASATSCFRPGGDASGNGATRVHVYAVSQSPCGSVGAR